MNSRAKHPFVGIVEVEHRIGKEGALAAGLQRIDLGLLQNSGRSIETAFRQLWAFEKSEDAISANACKEICFGAMLVALRHIDSTGVSREIGRLAPHLSDFSYQDNLPALSFDHAYLTQTLQVPEDKVLAFWRHVDTHRSQVIERMSTGHFAFEPLVAQARREFDSTEGEPWQHMSPGLWTKIAGGGLAAVNVAGAIGAITGIGAAIAVASCVAGSAGIFLG
jgi:hypothetical protein